MHLLALSKKMLIFFVATTPCFRPSLFLCIRPIGGRPPQSMLAGMAPKKLAASTTWLLNDAETIVQHAAGAFSPDVTQLFAVDSGMVACGVRRRNIMYRTLF